MLIAEASVATERSGRYLVQLCQHISRWGGRTRSCRRTLNGPTTADRSASAEADAPCVPTGVLTLRAEAADEDGLHRLEQRVADRLEQIGRRGRLTVTWTPAQGAGEQPPRRPTGAI